MVMARAPRLRATRCSSPWHVAALTKNVFIITHSVVMRRLRPFLSAIWIADADHPSSASRPSPEDAARVRRLARRAHRGCIEDKHAICIAIRPAKLEAEAAAAHKESLTFLGTIWPCSIFLFFLFLFLFFWFKRRRV